MKHVNAIECRIITKLVDQLIQHGYRIGVRDEEERVVRIGSNREQILAGIGHTDITIIDMKSPTHENAWVMLVHGNNEEVISDYTVNLEHIIEPM